MMFIVFLVIGVVLFAVALIFLGDFMNLTGWSFPRKLDWWTLLYALLTLISFAGLAYVIWGRH